MNINHALNLIDSLKRRVISFENGLTRYVYIQDAINDGWTTAFIIDANAEEQLFEQGINNLGVDISDYAPYGPYTIAIKEEKGQPTNRVTLRDEGDFESSFFLEVGDKQFAIKAGDFKTEELINKYGRQILGLTDANIAKLIWQYIFPHIITERNKLVYGKK